MPYATLRFAQMGWRVIRIEATAGGSAQPGDPNRYVGTKVVDDDRHSYFVAPNVGKESVAINLKDPRGHELLYRIIRALNVDVFCCNTLPARYEAMGIDYPSLKAVKPDIIWAGISAMGPSYPKRPGYDPAIQAMAGFMEMTGEADGPPSLSGIPLGDLKAGDEVYAAVALALLERAESGRGSEINISMLQAAASWLITTLPLLDFDCDYDEVSRNGNRHRYFIPSDAYRTRDGYIYLAIGNELQWTRFTDIPKFSPLADDSRNSIKGRYADRHKLYAEIDVITSQFSRAELARDFETASIPHALINTIEEVREFEAIGEKLTTTITPAGQTVRMQPPAVDRADGLQTLAFPPKYGEHTRSILTETGFSAGDIDEFADAGIID